MTHPADRLAYDRAMVAQPVWNRFTTGAEIGVAEDVLLHAGPPFDSVDQITRPILNSACVAAVYEGLARNFQQAEGMVVAGEIQLRPAQDFGVVTPLAAVVSRSMPLHVVYDAWGGAVQALAPINGGNRPALRLGLKSDAVLQHIQWLNTSVRDALQGGLAEGIALVPLAVQGLAGGDDCHGRTPVAGAALVDEIVDRSGPIDGEVLEFMRGSPSLFLNLWMAATKCMMIAASGVEDSSFITAAAGNGAQTGIQISGRPGQWFTTQASAPKGKFDVDLPTDRASGAIGDSAVVDAFGLGAMAVAGPGEAPKSSAMSVGEHPYFRKLNMRLGLSARSVIEAQTGPRISLGIIDRLGEAGRLGGGIYQMPLEPFENALK